MVNYVSNEPLNQWEVIGLQLTDDKSIYLQIGQMIEDSILRGIFLEEERVPSTNELSHMYAINPATAAKGINLLVERGILYKKRGIGMFVQKGAKAQIINSRRDSFYERYIVGLMSEAKSLQLTHEELVAMLKKAEAETTSLS